MALDRLKLTTGVALLLVGAQVAYGDPDPSIPGSYELTGTQDGAATTVKLEVGATGSVRREVTAGGITRS